MSMTPARFLEVREPEWARLEVLVAKGQQGLKRLSEDELHELTRRYRAVAVDVARARIYQVDVRLQRRINRLAITAHGLLYQRRAVPVLPAVGRFLTDDYPRLFRRLWPYTTLAVVLFFAASFGAYGSARLRPSLAYVYFPHTVDLGQPGLSEEDVGDRFRQMPRPPMAAGVITNNISVALLAFALGITAGVGTCYVVLVNAVMLGGFTALLVNHGLGLPLCTFILPHGLLEVFAILVAAGAGLRMGLSLAVPGRLTRGASLREGAREAVLLTLGTIPMFVVAGVIEGFVTPSYLTAPFKIGLGVLVLCTALAWVLLAGRRRVPGTPFTGDATP